MTSTADTHLVKPALDSAAATVIFVPAGIRAPFTAPEKISRTLAQSGMAYRVNTTCDPARATVFVVRQDIHTFAPAPDQAARAYRPFSSATRRVELTDNYDAEK